jgi:hypothetical protein
MKAKTGFNEEEKIHQEKMQHILSYLETRGDLSKRKIEHVKYLHWI